MGLQGLLQGYWLHEGGWMIGAKIVKKFTALYGRERFIT
jgi:hypothetical protein